MPLRARVLQPLRRSPDGWRLPRWRVLGLLSAMLAIVVLPLVATLSTHREAMDASQWVTHSAEVKALTYRIAFMTRDSEAATFRMIAGDADATVRARALRAGNEVPGLLSELLNMNADNPDQQAAVGALANAVNSRLALLEQARHRYQGHDIRGALAALHDAGTMFAIEGKVDTVVRNEGSLLLARRARAREVLRNSDLVLLLSAAGQIVLLSVIVLVAERQILRRAGAERRESQAVRRAQLVVQAVREPIALLDADLCVLMVNTAFSELYGLPQERIRTPQPLTEVGDRAWVDGALLQRLRDVLLHDRELWDYELVQRTAGGLDRHVVINARRLQQREDEDPVVLLTVSDITARALVEQQVKELNRQLEGKVTQITEANRELEAFSYSVSHDLRAPLRHIAGFTAKLQRHMAEALDETSSHYLEVIATSSRRMGQLIDDLLVFSRLGRGPLRVQAVDMQALVEEARALAESEVVDRDIQWHIASLPMVVGDETMLRTVWQNLIGNAVKYTGKRASALIEVQVRRERGGYYVFSVRDNGAGFDMEYAGKLFGVFQRLHRASEFPGNGIGLANVRRIIARHGGRVWAEGAPDQGACFYFSLPATDLAEARARRDS